MTLLFILVVSLYLPSLGSQIFVFDDPQLFQSLKAGTIETAADLFFSDNTSYFRPVVHWSFLFDKFLWNLDHRYMRVDNIIIHALNSILLLFLAYRVCSHYKGEHSEVALLVAALFAVNPLHTESINWISGRTDPIACLFVLLGLIFFMKSLDDKMLQNSLISSIFLLVACLAKEVAFGICIGIILYVLLQKPLPHQQSLVNPTFRRKACLAAPFLTGALVYLGLRFFCIRGADIGLDKIAQPTGAADLELSVLHQLATATKALGFYLKKLIIPVPSSFSIDHISEVYLWFGLFCLLPLVLLLLKRTLPAAMVLLMLGAIAPALFVAVYRIAWTPYAERYLYIPVAFSLLAGHLYIAASKPAIKKGAMILLLALFAWYLPVTVQRNLLWAQPIAFLEDSLKKTPNNLELRKSYAVTLGENRHYQKARVELLAILEVKHDDIGVSNALAYYSLETGDPELARSDLDAYFLGELTPDMPLLELMQKINERRLAGSLAVNTRPIRDELAIIHKKLFEITGKQEHHIAAEKYEVKNDQF